MTERRRAHLLPVLLLALGGTGAAGAYVAFGPSAPSTDPATFIGVGHSRPSGDAVAAHQPKRHGTHGHHPGAASGSDHGLVGVSGHGHGHGPHHHGHHHGGGHGTGGSGQIPGSKQFQVSVGDIGGLYPGRTRRLSVTYTNPNPFALNVTRAVVDTDGAPSCGTRFFVTGSYDPGAPVHVAGRSSASTTVPFGMRFSAPDTCQRVSVVVDVTATAVKS